MSEFTTGWYEIGFDKQTQERRHRFFKSTILVLAEFIEKPSGRTLVSWVDEKGRSDQWSANYPKAKNTTPEAWISTTSGNQCQFKTPEDKSRKEVVLSTREASQRAEKADAAQADGLSCEKEIHVGLFFDGTNNNMDRDLNDLSHSNVVSLFRAHKNDRSNHLRFYAAGVGTAFPEVDEDKESDNGKRWGTGGEARIHWGIIQIYNAIHISHFRNPLIPFDEAKNLCIKSKLPGAWSSKRASDMVDVFADIQQRLCNAIADQRPRITKIHLSVFGFSRGAAQARAFCQWIQLVAKEKKIGFATLEINFLGIFDTVASSGLPASSGIANGFQNWANKTMDIRGVQRCVHYVAAHEIRQNFPLSSARIKGNGYPANTQEYVYPGAHSDVGGGYAAGSQGKGVGGRSNLVSQVPLMDMYAQALISGVRLDFKDEMAGKISADFEIDPKLDKAFSDYIQWTKFSEKQDISQGGAAVENRLRSQMGLYWSWRASKAQASEFEAMQSYQAANAQDRQNLADAETDWKADVRAAEKAVQRAQSQPSAYDSTPAPRKPSEVQQRLLAAVAKANDIPKAVDQFLDQYIHDSHAGFYMLGPITQQDTDEFIAKVKEKKEAHDAWMARQTKIGNFSESGSFEEIDEYRSPYKLNQFEKRVIEQDAKQPGTMALMSDVDAPELRESMGIIMGTGVRIFASSTRRESDGHGRYREVFDWS
ncbi:DUF2235 domain-containing protein [Comamonas sp. GB3 AK4-5]|uniref:T6SS phospholipase effector Tle1-like catalytic domain-containing protein n=1 Tax=Comamonas sp. GB3 AK4-5 TaxID=3231487 RepID=UPI00351E80F0